MDRRGWPWKKKSSNKTITYDAVSASDSSAATLASVASLGDQENCKKMNYVQISVDSYTRLTGLEDQVKLLKDEMQVLKEKLSRAHSEINSKDVLVKQHEKVSEEAVSGWEKAEAEALALKRQLESITVLKLAAEDRASHLDGALKECMRQVRNVKEESEQKLHETILNKNKQWDKLKHDLELKVIELDQSLLLSSAENAALARSLQERSNLIVKLNEEKSQSAAEIEFLKENIQSSGKEISQLKYELHLVSKELDIRNEERNMSLRSAEVANKQHLDSVRKIAKLEAECQRLRGLVRKKLPGPAALAQMKLEAENSGKDSTEPQKRRDTSKNPKLHIPLSSEFTIDKVQQSYKATEFLTTSLTVMEEEMKTLKEALSTRNSELQASRNMCAKAVVRLKNLETQIQALNPQKSSLKLNFGIPTEGSLNQSNPCSITSISESGIDEEGSSSESWAPLISGFRLSRDKNIDESNKHETVHHLELMDDFLEMERLACLSDDANVSIPIQSKSNDRRSHNTEDAAWTNSSEAWDLHSEELPGYVPSPEQDLELKPSRIEHRQNAGDLLLVKLRSRISSIIDTQTKNNDMGKVLEDIKHALQDILGSLPEQSVTCLSEEAYADVSFCSRHACSEDAGKIPILAQDSKPSNSVADVVKQTLNSAISHIHQFILLLGREAMPVWGSSANGRGLSKNVQDFSASVDDFMFRKISLVDLIFKLSEVLVKASELNFSFLGLKSHDGDVSNGDYIDKVTLLEKKVVLDQSSKRTCIGNCSEVTYSYSDIDAIQKENFATGSDSDVTSFKCSLKEFENLKQEKDKMATGLAKCCQDLENAKLQLEETENLLSELKVQLASSQKSHSLAEIQLKCMTESYKFLEMHAQGLENEVSILRGKTEKLDIELLEEKRSCQDAVTRCKDLQDRLQRNESCLRCSLLSAAASDVKTKQEKEIVAAAERLAECQETINIIGKQLQALQPQTDIATSKNGDRPLSE